MKVHAELPDNRFRFMSRLLSPEWSGDYVYIEANLLYRLLTEFGVDESWHELSDAYTEIVDTLAGFLEES